MPTNGEVNKELGIYRSACCGAEIVIIAGATFPDCPRHPKLTITWNPTTDAQPVRKVHELPDREKKAA